MPDAHLLLNLPFETLTELVAGYLGYRLAYTGKDATHRVVDVIFRSLAFALAAKLIFLLPWPVGIAPKAPLSIATALLVAAVWRAWGEDSCARLLRRGGISFSDRHVTAWDSVRMKPRFAPATLIVTLADGRRLECDDLSRFMEFDAGPCILGSDGSVAMFVTHQSAPGEEDWTEREISCGEWGTELTYVPANQIAEIKVFLRR